MFCAISGGVPEEPVVTTDGHVFERRLIEKHIEETGRHPVTSEDLKKEDLISLKSTKTVKPRPSPATSIPGLLGLFHNEWDALMLETHSLKQSLDSSRQELAHALYQHDAACRVIARLMRERDQARADAEAALAAAPTANGKRAADDDGGEQPAKKARQAGLDEEVIAAMTACSAKLSAARKGRKPPPDLTTAEEIAAFQQLASQPLHKTNKGGIKAIDTSPAGSLVVATAGGDGAVTVYDTAEGRVLATLRGNSKKPMKVNDVKFVGSQGSLLSASSDKKAYLWVAGDDGAYASPAVLSTHSAEVTAVTVHPTHDYFVTASMDKTWAFYDVATAACLTQVADPDLDCGITSAEFHPDGLIMATGCQDATVRIWDVKSQKSPAKFTGHTAPITDMSFSENGYYLATSAADGVKLWDLRKLKNVKTLTPYDGAAATSVSFDHSGMFLAVGGPDVRVYSALAKADWPLVATYSDLPSQGANALKFGDLAKTLYVGAGDHNLRVYGSAIV